MILGTDLQNFMCLVVEIMCKLVFYVCHLCKYVGCTRLSLYFITCFDFTCVWLKGFLHEGFSFWNYWFCSIQLCSLWLCILIELTMLSFLSCFFPRFRNCPIDLKEAISSVVFASPRCSDIPELMDVRKHVTAKYGKEFVSAAVELRPDCGVNRLASFSSFLKLDRIMLKLICFQFYSNLMLSFSWLRNCLPKHPMVQPR